MQKEFTKEYMTLNKGCYSEEELNKCSFMSNEIITLDSILESEIKLKDKFWFVCEKLNTKEQNQKLAIDTAEIVLEIYENKYPNNKAPREAIQAAKDYFNNTGITLEQLREKRNAAYAAYAAADAAYAAATAAYAAAAAAAYAAAAYAADAAAYAAAYAAANAEITTKDFNKTLLEYLKEFCKNA